MGDTENKAAIDAAKAVAIQAAHDAATAAIAAAQKPGFKTSEFAVSLIGIAVAAVTSLADKLSSTPGPWQLPAIGIAAGLIIVAGYGYSRSSLKAAALAAAGAALEAATKTHSMTPAAPAV